MGRTLDAEREGQADRRQDVRFLVVLLPIFTLGCAMQAHTHSQLINTKTLTHTTYTQTAIRSTLDILLLSINAFTARQQK